MPVAALTRPPAGSVPLCVDLDGTLIRTDVLWESLLNLVKRRPWELLRVPFWWARGRANLKQQLAVRVALDVTALPYHLPFLEFLRAEHAAGRTLILATAADRALAEPIARHVGLFAGVEASDGATNLRGANKVRHLTAKYGPRGFDYAGNSTVDLPVWAGSRRAIVVNADERLAVRARELTEVSHVFNEPRRHLAALVRTLRPHQWVKNLIIFVPLLTSHQLGNFALLSAAVLAFAAFSLAASAVYVLNDLLDLEADRRHATKRHRPLAAGELEAPAGFGLLGGGLLLGGLLAAQLPAAFAGVLALYLVLTTTYTLRLKQIVLVDVFCLAGLYTLRLVAGHAATGVRYSPWLLAFSMFLFLSLALVKRFTELRALGQSQVNAVPGRGYLAEDRQILAILGLGSGGLAVLVLALYVHSPEVAGLYAHPLLLLAVCPLLLYWISRVWLLAHRGLVHEDPIVFALRDRASYLIGGLTLLVLWLATRG